ncbi:DNA-3-methyladenine glycosylase [Delftia tsuruhatensis]|uniref:DNA-3-methyladenine glycosylase 2 n=1 Tax=Delftia tsuruhatensis TaxID=180282 RepID=UPI001E6F29A6|nr:DNA-3-methyladenine glycosylase 2 family protein [Delftia tsuruhatensis]CAB5704466.1 DNA-3-methyladenine glycosylase [Delftia tsuruhatensis]CAC9689731.1 DNA-3-methyladenine glycosylase [Delftia tsuruhatensis]
MRRAAKAPRRAEQSLVLPVGYRMAEFWGFHRRDAQRLSECDVQDASGLRMHKGLMWRGQPTLLTLALVEQSGKGTLVQARWSLPDGAGQEQAIDEALAAMLGRMFGLSQDVERFERRFGRHAQLGPLLVRQHGLHVPAACTPWEALSWAVTGQQISVAAAVSLRRRLIAAAGRPVSLHDDHADAPQQLWCMPEAAQVAQLGEQDLRAAGFSQGKTQTLRLLAQAVQAGELPLDDWAAQPVVPAEKIAERLLAVKGIGPWTVNYTLLRGYGHLDGPLHGDVAVRRALARLLQVEAMDARQTELWLRDFAPWRALVAAHLWASLSSMAF